MLKNQTKMPAIKELEVRRKEALGTLDAVKYSQTCIEEGIRPEDIEDPWLQEQGLAEIRAKEEADQAVLDESVAREHRRFLSLTQQEGINPYEVFDYTQAPAERKILIDVRGYKHLNGFGKIEECPDRAITRVFEKEYKIALRGYKN